jgi:hypothetical protein
LFVVISLWLHVYALAYVIVFGGWFRPENAEPHIALVHLEQARASTFDALEPIDESHTDLPADQLEAVGDIDVESLSPQELELLEQLLALRASRLKEDIEEEKELEQRLKEWLEFVRTEAEMERPKTSTAPFISAHNSNADKMARTPVLTSNSGPHAPTDDGSNDSPASRGSKAKIGNTVDPMGSVENGEEASKSKALGGGGRQGQSMGRGSPNLIGTDEAGGAAAPAGGAVSPRIAGNPMSKKGYKAAPRGTADPTLAGSTTWDPVAMGVLVAVEPSSAPTAANVPATTEGFKESVVEKVGKKKKKGGVRGEVDEPAQQGPPLEQEADGVAVVEDPGNIDPVDDLRQSLGWGGMDRSQLKPRNTTLAVGVSDGYQQRSAQTVLSPEYEVSNVVRVSAVSTEVGVYIQRVDEILARRWADFDLDPHERAVGWQGQVVIEFHIAANGKVGDVEVVSSSGCPSLDDMGQNCVPGKLPHFPAALELNEVMHRVTLRYRNPLIGGE